MESPNGSRRCEMRGLVHMSLRGYLPSWEDAPNHLSMKSEDLPTSRQRARAGCTDAQWEGHVTAPMTTQQSIPRS